MASRKAIKSVTTIQFLRPPSGPISGGTEISFHGKFNPILTYEVEFTIGAARVQTIVPGKLFNASIMTCESPPVPEDQLELPVQAMVQVLFVDRGLPDGSQHQAIASSEMGSFRQEGSKEGRARPALTYWCVFKPVSHSFPALEVRTLDLLTGITYSLSYRNLYLRAVAWGRTNPCI